MLGKGEAHMGEIVSRISYITSGTLIFADVTNLLTYLDTHAGAFGVILGFMTFLVNWFYQHRREAILIESMNKEDD